MNQRKCSCSLSLSRSSLRVGGVPQTQPPSLNGPLPRREKGARPWPLHLPGGGPPKWSGVAAVLPFCVLGRRLTKRRPPGHLENTAPHRNGGVEVPFPYHRLQSSREAARRDEGSTA